MKNESFKTNTQKLLLSSRIMSLLNLDPKFQGCFVISTSLHLSLISGPNSNGKLSLEMVTFRDLGTWGVGVRIRDTEGRAYGKSALGRGTERILAALQVPFSLAAFRIDWKPFRSQGFQCHLQLTRNN